jgi:hypothetical protein
LKPRYTASLSRCLPAVLLVAAVVGLLFRPLTGATVLVPGNQLQHVHPWTSDSRPPWNVLQFDGVAQFLPWRAEVARQWNAGIVPLSNPKTFATSGGSPILANSQSAPFYPPNILFWLAGENRVEFVFAWSAALHLVLLGWGMVTLLRHWGFSDASATAAALVAILNTHLLAWLPLPTHICVLAWTPWIMLAISRRRLVVAGALLGTAFLGGHLQIAALLAFCVLTAECWIGRHEPWPARLRNIATLGILATAVSAVQFLPALEIGRQSHRGGVAPTLDGYRAYVANAVPAHFGLSTLVPDFFGNPSKGSGANWIVSAQGQPNAFAEWTHYIGIAGLMLALSGLINLLSRRDRTWAANLGWLPFFVVIALLLAFGTELNRVPYFLVPGFASTGNPGRILGVATITLGIATAVGLETASRRSIFIVVTLLAVIAGITCLRSFQVARSLAIEPTWATTLSTPAVLMATFAFLPTMLALWHATSSKSGPNSKWPVVVILAVDLFMASQGNIAQCDPTKLRPTGGGIEWLANNVNGIPVAAINTAWSLSVEGPSRANPIMVPNLTSLFGLHDVGGYDSLILRKTKESIRGAHGGLEPSPPENGNMVFCRSLEAASNLGAAFALLPPGAAPNPDSTWTLVYSGADMAIAKNQGYVPSPKVRIEWATPIVRTGIFLSMISWAALLANLLTRDKRSASPRTAA